MQAGKPYEGVLGARCETGIPAVVALESADGAKTYAEASLPLSPGDLKEINTPDQPRRIAPTQAVRQLVSDGAGTGIVYTFPAHSFTILRIP